MASRWRSGRSEAAASHFSQYASAERRASSHVVRCPMGLRQPFGRLSPWIFHAHCSRSASGSLATVATGSSPLNPCQSPFSSCSQRITGSAPHGTELRAQRSNLEKAKLEVTAMATGKRELIDTGTDKRYVGGAEKGRFDEVVDVGRSLSQARKRQAEHESKPGHGDRGDSKR